MAAPYSFALLIGLAIGVPFVLRAYDPGRERNVAIGILVMLFLVSLGLLLLEWSRAACWITVALGIAVLGGVSFRERQGAGFVVGLVFASILGLGFQFSPARWGEVVYVGAMLPVMVTAALLWALSDRMRYDRSRFSQLSVAFVGTFGVFTPFSAFLPGYLRWYEPVHLFFLGLTLLGLVRLGRGSLADLEAGRRRRFGHPDVLTYLGQPLPGHQGTIGRVLARVGAASGAASILYFLLGGQVSWLALFAGLVGIAIGIWARAYANDVQGVAPRLEAGLGLTLLLSTLVVGVDAAGQLHLVGAPAWLGLSMLSISAFASWTVLFALIDASARHRELRERQIYSEAFTGVVAGPNNFRTGLPRGTWFQNGSNDLKLKDVEAFAKEAARLRAPMGVYVVPQPRNDPMWTLPPAVYAFLLNHAHDETPIHIAIKDLNEVCFVPPVVPEEDHA